MAQRKKRETTLNFLKLVPDDFVNLNRIRFIYKYGKAHAILLKSFQAENLSYLSHVHRLDAVTFRHGGMVDADVLHELAPLNLRYLCIGNKNQCRDADLAALENWKGLEYLNLQCSDNITGVGLAHLQKIEQLTNLYIYCNRHITDTDIVPLTFLPRLEKLCILYRSDVGSTDITGEKWVHHGMMGKLQELTIKADWTRAGLKKLASWLGSLPKLENLLLYHQEIDQWTDDSLRPLEAFFGPPMEITGSTCVKWEAIRAQEDIIEYVERSQMPLTRSVLYKRFSTKHHYRAMKILEEKGVLKKMLPWDTEEEISDCF